MILKSERMEFAGRTFPSVESVFIMNSTNFSFYDFKKKIYVCRASQRIQSPDAKVIRICKLSAAAETVNSAPLLKQSALFPLNFYSSLLTNFAETST